MDNELKQHLTAMEERLKTYMDERSEKIETKLLSAFHGWSRSMEIRAAPARP